MTETYDADMADSDDVEPATPTEPPAADDGSGLSSGARAFFDWVVVVGVALLVAILVRTFLLAHFVVDGQSMYSTLSPGDRVFVNKMSYQLHEPGRGDVVVLHEISGAIERDLIKRVVALPGEEIRMENCVVWIDTDPADDVPAQRHPRQLWLGHRTDGDPRRLGVRDGRQPPRFARQPRTRTGLVRRPGGSGLRGVLASCRLAVALTG